MRGKLTARNKLLEKILNGRSDNNVAFDDLCHLMRQLGFAERIRGGHHIFRKAGVREHLNLQKDNSLAKGYQVRQIRNLIIKYGLG